jgi:hypothetical protein
VATDDGRCIMSVFETVAEVARRIHDAEQTTPGNWSVGTTGMRLAWAESAYSGADPAPGNRLMLAQWHTRGRHETGEWLSHPAVHLLRKEELSGYALPPEVALAPWVLEDGALEAILAAEVDPDYARAAHTAGVTDAWQLIEAWRHGIAVEYLGAMGGAS